MIIILTGKSCSGKDSIRKILVEEYGYKSIISYTSRPKRENEINGREYYFVNKEEMKEKEFIDYREYKRTDGIWGYGHKKIEIDNNYNYVCIVDLKGAKQFKNIYKDNCIVIYIESNARCRTERARERGDDISEWLRRLDADNIDFDKKFLRDIVDYTIINENIELKDIAKQINQLVNES